MTQQSLNLNTAENLENMEMERVNSILLLRQAIEDRTNYQILLNIV